MRSGQQCPAIHCSTATCPSWWPLSSLPTTKKAPPHERSIAYPTFCFSPTHHTHTHTQPLTSGSLPSGVTALGSMASTRPALQTIGGPPIASMATTPARGGEGGRGGGERGGEEVREWWPLLEGGWRLAQKAVKPPGPVKPLGVHSAQDVQQTLNRCSPDLLTPSSPLTCQ